MMEFSYNRNKTDLLRVMKSKGEKKNLKIKDENDKIEISLEPGKFSKGEDAIPVVFKGKMIKGENRADGCSIKGRFSYGFYLTTLVIVAVVLILARFLWSAFQKQLENVILCGIVTALLIVVIVVVQLKAKSAKKLINDFLNNLNVK